MNPRPPLSPGPGASDEMRDGGGGGGGAGSDAPSLEGAAVLGSAAGKPAVIREEC